MNVPSYSGSSAPCCRYWGACVVYTHACCRVVFAGLALNVFGAGFGYWELMEARPPCSDSVCVWSSKEQLCQLCVSLRSLYAAEVFLPQVFVSVACKSA